jgi:hypothetical protein
MPGPPVDLNDTSSLEKKVTAGVSASFSIE